MKSLLILLSFAVCAIPALKGAKDEGYKSKNLENPYKVLKNVQTKLDTVPIKDRPSDFTNPYKKNPFDLKDPSAIDKSIEYDIKTGRYLINEKIGNEYYRNPSSMTFDEYLKWRSKNQEREYFDRLTGVSNSKTNKKDPLSKLSSNDPLKKMDLKNQLIDRLFGGTNIDIRTQGNIDVTLGANYQRNQNPIFPVQSQKYTNFDFDMDIRMNVTGKIGEKLNLSTNFNTKATFDFENQMKLNYDTKNFSEDAIVQKIEAGNVSLPLKGTLIQGTQSLFGFKTELQFGYLRLTGIASQQKSQRQNIKVQSGGQVQQFAVFADQYDENRHFFLSHINRELFEGAMKNLPQISTQIKITDIDVWVTNDRNEPNSVRDVVALADLGEADVKKFTSINMHPRDSNVSYDLSLCNTGVKLALPDNNANPIYKTLNESEDSRKIDNVLRVLQGAPFEYQQSKDFEKLRARKLNPSEYTFQPDLGFISLNFNLRPNQVLAVGYRYLFNGTEVHSVGEIGNDVGSNNDSSRVVFLKLLKNQITNVDLPVWNLMMKNIYSTGAYQANREDFRLDVAYQDPKQGNLEKRFLPEPGLEKTPLINLFGLDRLNIQGDPQPDGIFDYVPEVTIQPKTGRIMFPVLEPFGKSLDKLNIDTAIINKKYKYPELYNNTVTYAREFTEKNRFVIRGQYKSSTSSEISLGGINIAKGLTVTAGSIKLVEGVDYEVDYTIGKVRILKDEYITSNLPINISYEDNTLFGLQTKTLLGVRADYSLGKQLGIGDLNIGATYMHLFERPYTQKVNIGDDPINNRIYGMDVQYNAPAPWITRMIDKLPFISTKAPSSIALTGEGALLQPGHASAINQSRDDSNGAIYIDDFEGSASSIDLRQPVQWFLASVPKGSIKFDSVKTERFRESKYINDLRSGVNRAAISWYRIDQGDGGASDQDPYTANIDPATLFKNTFFQPGQTFYNPFDIHFDPSIRGPYNFDLPNGVKFDSSNLYISAGLQPNGLLKDPKSRWGGIMRALQQTDFEQANIEYLDFWMMSPFINDNSNPGTLQIHLGNLSEDVMPDSKLFYENALPTPLNAQLKVDTTAWGFVPKIPPITNSFDVDTLARTMQDVGYDGMNDIQEAIHFKSYLESVKSLDNEAYTKILSDPANDNFKFFRDQMYKDINASAIVRYSRNNYPQGNSKSSNGNSTYIQAATNLPDIEDLNKDFSLSESENYYLYNIPLKPDNSNGIDASGNSYITDTLSYTINGQTFAFYRFRIPLNDYKERIGVIRDFRAIQFMRVVLTDFEKPVTLRFAKFELGRNQWRKYRRPFLSDQSTDCKNDQFDLNKVNIEENSSRTPFNYVLPAGIIRENNIGGFLQNALQNEQSLAIKFEKFCGNTTKAIYKLTNLDLRLYERMKMFVHFEGAESNAFVVKENTVSAFLRFGGDLENNYYEYEIPLKASDILDANKFNSISDDYKKLVWPDSNNFNFKLSILKDLKLNRDKSNFNLDSVYAYPDPDRPTATVKIKGSPNYGLVKGIMIGFRNNKDEQIDCEAWVNELRCTGLDERGGYAATGKLDIKLADLGTLNFSGSYFSVGWGSIDQRVLQRSRESTKIFDMATNLELGKFLPSNWGIRLPFYAQYSSNIKRPEYDPYDLDVTLDEKLSRANTTADKDTILDRALTKVHIRGYSFNNVRKERVGRSAAKPMPWDIENFSVSYSNTQTTKQDPIIQLDQLTIRKFQVDYGYTRNVTYWTPFKKLIKKDKYLKFISEFNLNLLPNSFNVNSLVNRQLQQTTYRFAGEDPIANTYYNKRYGWLRNYSLNWDFTKSLKFSFQASNTSVIDELNEFSTSGSRYSDAEKTKKINEGLLKGGRNKNYNHSMNLNYTVPLKNIPLMDWVNLRAQYGSTYSWSAAALNVDTLGNVIQNTLNYQINGDLNFETLYNQWGYLKKINEGGSTTSPARGPKPTKSAVTNPIDSSKVATRGAKAKKKEKKKEEYVPSLLEKIVIRPLMTIRKARLVYDEKFNSVVPGFKPTNTILGMQDFNAPGVGYVVGKQPDYAWLKNAGNNDWITRSVYLNQPVLTNHVQSISGTLNLEPFRDFKVDVEIKQDFAQNKTQFYKCDCSGEFQKNERTQREVGSYSISYMSIRTMFKDGNNDLIGLFNQFEKNRLVISNRLAGPGAAAHEIDLGYKEGYGRSQLNVLIPSFLSAYAGKDPNTFQTNVFKMMPIPNWRLNYNGLSRLPMFKDILQSFQLTHSYKSTMTVASFASDLLYDPIQPTKINTITGSYYARFTIPNVVVNEQFAPLIGVDMRLKNDMSFKFDYKKSRNLSMSFIDYQLSETKTTDITFGFGYTAKNIRLSFLDFLTNLDPSIKLKTKKDKKDKNAKKTTTPVAVGGANQPNNLNFKLDFSIRDDVTYNHVLDQNIVQPTRGANTIKLSPSIDYTLNKSLNLRLFVDYTKTLPKTSASTPITQIRGGLTVRFTL